MKIKTTTYFRDLRIDSSVADDRTVELSFSSETPYKRDYFIGGESVACDEILVHSINSVDLSRLANSAPLLINHENQIEKQIGVIESVRIDGGKGFAKVRFSKKQLAEEVLNDVRDNIIKNVSVGYVVNDAEYSPEQKTMRITRWTPHEISIVGVPADETVGIYRCNDTSEKETEVTILNSKTEDRKMEKKDMQEMLAIAQKHGKMELFEKALESEMTLDAFRKEILDNQVPVKIEVKEERKVETKPYSFGSAIRSLMTGENSYEKEMSREYAMKNGKSLQGLWIPTSAFARDMVAASNPLVGVDTRGDLFVDMLKENILAAKLGANFIGGLVGNVSIPRLTAGAIAYWGNATESTPTLDEVTLSAKPVRAYVEYSDTLLLQSTPAVDQIVKNDVIFRLANAIDTAIFAGTGTSQPIGILDSGATGVQTLTFGGAPTWAKVVEFETLLSAANVVGNLNFVMSASAMGSWKTRVKETGAPVYLIGDDGKANGIMVHASAKVTGNKVICGDFSQIIVGLWDAVHIVIDDKSKAEQGLIRLIATQHADVGIRQPTAFVKSTDAGNQSGS